MKGRVDNSMGKDRFCYSRIQKDKSQGNKCHTEAMMHSETDEESRIKLAQLQARHSTTSGRRGITSNEKARRSTTSSPIIHFQVADHPLPGRR